jgi:hypothetical protein
MEHFLVCIENNLTVLLLQIKFRECSQSLSPKSFVFLSHIKNCSFVSCAVWVRNLVSHFEGGTQTEGF